MKILVTGAAGFIGSHVSLRLVAAGHRVIGIDNLDPYYSLALKRYNLALLQQSPKFSFVESDVTDQAKLSKLISELKPKAIIHLAAKAGVRNSIQFPETYFHTNVCGTLNILQAATQAKVKKVLVASSSSVYGSNEQIPFSETDEVNNQISPYAASKRSVETLCQMYHRVYGLPIQLFRFFTVYGPSGRPDMAPAIFARLISQDQPITVFGSLDTERDYTYVDDIVAGLMAALEVDDGCEMYNLGNDQPMPLHRLIAAFEQAFNTKAKVEIGPTQPGDVPRTWANIDKARQRLDFHPSTSLEKGIELFVDWFKQHHKLYQSDK